MATVKEKSEGKSMFLKEYLMDNPGAGAEAVAAAWGEAGNEGTISASLVGKVRRELGLTGKGLAKAKSKARKGADAEGRGRTLRKEKGESEREDVERSPAPQVAGGERADVLMGLEDSIDELLHEMKRAGGLPEFEEALRKARRILIRSQVE